MLERERKFMATNVFGKSFKMHPCAAFILLILINSTFGQQNPLKDPNICGKPTCTTGGAKFEYRVGTKYEYKYLVDISSLFEGTSKNKSTLYVEAVATLEFISRCDGLLTLSDVVLSENPIGEEQIPVHPNGEFFAEDVSEHALRFSFKDGIITEVCPQDEEKSWVLNFKKGLLSMIHNTMNRFDLDHSNDEEDIKGTCSTKYVVRGAKETSLIIEKTKDMNSCRRRSKLHSILQSTPYNFRPGQQSTLLKSSSFCKLTIDHNIYSDIKCEESHVFQPFSNQAAGATTIVKQRLILLPEVTGTLEEQSLITRRSSLLYDQIPTPKPTSGELRTSRDLIKKLCKLSADDVQTEFSYLFTKFIHTARLLSYAALTSLYGHAGTICKTGRKHVLDALPYLSSTAAVSLMKDIILINGVSESTSHEWLMAIAFIPRPEEAALGPAKQLLESKPRDPAIALSVSALTRTFCEQNFNCRSKESADGIIQLLEDQALQAYEYNNIDAMLIYLKALANVGLASEDFKFKLRDFIEDGRLATVVRVAAVETHRKFPCEESRSYFEKLFRNQDEDVEARIAAYLQIMRCPNYIVIQTIQHSLESEEVNQVGSFVWSHLRNLLKSSIPSRLEIQSLLSNKELGKKFSSDVRKFSHNYEGSVFFEEYNAGANYESNLIFSPSSYIPRSAMLNLTVDLFGESINLLEIYGRMEGFEHYIESIFGPKGSLSSMKLQEKIPKMRWGRSVDDNEIKTQVENLNYTMKNSFGDPKVSLGFKVFGNELKYKSFNGQEEIMAALQTVNPVDYLKRILSGKEISYNKAAMFLDSTYVVPSGAGFPITLNAVGTASINLKIFGSLRAANFMQTKELDLVGSFHPGVALDVVGTMAVDAYYASTGIKLKTNMYTSSAVEGNIKIRGTNLVSIKFSLPRQTTEIFGAQSELIVIQKEVEHRQSGITTNRVSQSLCSWPSVEKTIGLKLCADYHFPNVTKINNAPFLVVAGPAGFRLSLQKSDPTAKIYLLEYKWTKTYNGNLISLTFDTPGSAVRRLLGANLTLNTQSQNVTLLLQSEAGTILARGNYKNTETEKYLKLRLDINNKKHFDASISLERKETRNGLIYLPKFHVGVNADRIVDLEGTIKSVKKMGILQCDVDLKFQTKRLTSKLFGYISKSDASLGANLKLDYIFVNSKAQRVTLDFSLANRSTRTLVSIYGDSRLENTAYPYFNFETLLRFKKTAGHVECKLKLDSSPHLRDDPAADRDRLTLETLFTYRTMPDTTRFNIETSLRKPISGLDLGVRFSYDVKGPDTLAQLTVQYNPTKSVIITVFWSHPRGTFVHMEGNLNITVPSFKPMVIEGKIHEKQTADYDVELSATWFSGHNLTMRGIYQDKSSTRASNHHLKMLIKSPSFKEINSDCQYFRDDVELKLSLKAIHNEDEYAVFVKHTATSPYEIYSQGKLKYKAKVYSITTSVNLREQRQLLIELHIDQLRDIHLTVWGHNQAARKTAGLEVKWDANRDPNQKLAITAEFSNPRSYKYDGNFVVSYPGRNINGLFDFVLEDSRFETIARFSWSSSETIAIQLGANYKNDVETLIGLHSELLTPFDDWKQTSLTGGYRHGGNLYQLNGSLHWQQDQHVSFNLFGDYTITTTEFQCEYNGSLSSSIRDIPSLSASIQHHHNSSKVDTNLHVMYYPNQRVAIKSLWKIDEDAHTKNLTGTVSLVSPFTGFNRGLLVSKIFVTDERNLRGIADLDLDHKKFIASVEGYFKKITKCFFVFNVSTPLEKYKKIQGQFGFIEERKHLVAKINYPIGKIGLEILFHIQSISNFDVKFDLATPIDFLQQVLLVAQLNPDRADFRVAWNLLLAGFSGVWHYVNITDFEYLYKIYTPIEGFEENGAIAKFILKEGVDFAVSVKLGDHRLGALIVSKPKQRILEELGIKTQTLYNGKFLSSTSVNKDDDDNNDDYEDEEADPLSWSTLVEIDILLYPTITGTLDIDQKGTVYVLLGALTLPDGIVELKDEFDFIDAFTMKNRLQLSTPYNNYKLVTSNYDFFIEIGEHYFLSLNFDHLNRTQWIKYGVSAEYRVKGDDEDLSQNVTVHLHSPFGILPYFDIHAGLETEESDYKINFTLNTIKSDVKLYATTESNDGLLDVNVGMHALTPFVSLPPVKFGFKKDLTDAENRIELNCNVFQNKSNQFKIEAVWHYDSVTNFKSNLYLETPFKGTEKSNFGAEVSLNNANVLANVRVLLNSFDINGNLTFNSTAVNSIVLLRFSRNRYNVSLQCDFFNTSNAKRNLKGYLTIGDTIYAVSGVVKLAENIPVNVLLQLEPKKIGEPIILEYTLQPQPLGYAIRTSVRQNPSFASAEVHIANRRPNQLDLYIQLDTSHEIFKTFIIKSTVALSNQNYSIVIDSETPFERLQKCNLGAFLVISGSRRNGRVCYEIPDYKGSVDTEWNWSFMEDMNIKVIGNYESPNATADAGLEVFYYNPQKNFQTLKIGGDVNVQKDVKALITVRTFKTGTNLSLSWPTHQNINFNASIRLPPPFDEVHSIQGKFYCARNMESAEYLAQYNTAVGGHNYATSGNLYTNNRKRTEARIGWQWRNRHVDNYVDLKRGNGSYDLLYKLKTPKFNESTIVSKMTYKRSAINHNVNADFFYPEFKLLGAGKINFRELNNMNGSLNVTGLFKGFNYTGGNFIIETNAIHCNRYVQLFWPNNTALAHSKYYVRIGPSALERNTTGILLLEVPLTTRHNVRVDYGYAEKFQLTTGHATINYNNKTVLDNNYKCLSESRAGYDKDTVHVELENKFIPVGVVYVHGFEYNAPGDGSNTPTVDYKHVEIYHLHNRSRFNVSGDVQVKTTFTGQQIEVLAIHSNRTVKFRTDYDVLDHQFKQNLRLELGPNVWIAYNLDLINKTVDETADAQQMQINVSYPRRNFIAEGSYNISNSYLFSEISLFWNKKEKMLQAAFDWKRDETYPNRQQVQLQIKHPSFQKNVSVVGEYARASTKVVDMQLTVNYSTDVQKLLKLGGTIENHSRDRSINYTYAVRGTHPATNLDLYARGEFSYRPRWYYTSHLADYKRTYLPLQSAESSVSLNLDGKEIELKKKSLHELSYFWGRYAGKFPVYTANVSAIRGKDINASGEFYFNFKGKLLRLDLNMTEDGSQSMHMYGLIPDARSTYFDSWRDYEDIRIKDITFYLRLNHSRLIVSNLKWRPEIKQEIQNNIQSFMKSIYNEFLENTDYWKQYIRSETADAISDVWMDAKPNIQGFLDDFRDLKILEEDLAELKTFLNKSYHDNEFYIRDIVGFLVYVVDELAIKSHLESLPAIVNEIWDVMGESGRKIQKSIGWVIEKIKTYYKHATEFINGIMLGDSLEHLSQAFTQLLEKYDEFIKDLHVSFMRYMEQLWKQTNKVLLDNWHKMLIIIEPTFIKFIHYVETIVWTTSKEFLDFLYLRKSEIIDNPYFSKFSNLTHDMDKLYKDFTGNNTIANIYKYATVVWNFVEEKYVRNVPFGKELQALTAEVINELQELKKLPSIQFLIVKANEVYAKTKWFYDYFDVGNKLHRFITLIHLKLTDMTQTALQAENRYREAKTKFIFEPADGVMQLEQKLPMSWHAFNETPKFQEIPEYRFIHKIQNYFVTSKTTFWNFYYDYKPYTDPSDWMPPFKAQAMIVAGQHFITFDRSYHSLSPDNGNFLLATDFLDHNFTVSIQYNGTKMSELLLLIHNTVVHIDVFSNAIKVGNSLVSHLPVEIGDAFVYQDADIITVNSASGFTLQCNMKFDICTLELSGWYFGKTAGLWGTMNNEPSDDLLTSQRIRTKDMKQFTQSWILDKENYNLGPLGENATQEIRALCDVFFKSKVSHFATCFPRVDSKPFLNMCLNGSSEFDACTSAVAYMDLCSYVNTPLRIPDVCVKCNLQNGKTLAEGSFIRLEGDLVLRSTDLVFIVEAKDCNKNITAKRKIDIILETLEKELISANITQNRYALVTFGGIGVFNRPRSVVIDNDIFTDYKSISEYFKHFTVGNGNADIFNAISFATRLIFRPGVAKTFILLPCTDCHESNMKLDYAILHQLLLENDITLHILMDEDFSFMKHRVNKIFYGLDSTRAYTKKDAKSFKGDAGLRRQVRLPKAALGFCTPLALETNGSIFSGKKLETEKSNDVKKLATVLSRRVAQSAVPSSCQLCECTAPNTGISYMECFSCEYPTSTNIDYGFNEDETLSVMQPDDEELNNSSE